MTARPALVVVSVAVLGGTALAQPAPSAPTQTLPGWGGTVVPQPGQAALPGGFVTVAPGSVVVTYYEVRPVNMTASNLLRTEVRNLYRAVQFQATGRSKTRPLRRSTADAVNPPKAKPPKLLQPIWPLYCRWLEPAAHGG